MGVNRYRSLRIMEVYRNRILEIKGFFEENSGKYFRFKDLTKGLKISDITLFEIIGILQREYNLPLTWSMTK